MDTKKESKNMDYLEIIIGKIMEEANLNNLPEPEKTSFQENLAMQFNRRIGLIIMDNLPEEGLKEYTALIKDSIIPDKIKLQELIIKYIPDFENKMKDGLDSFIQEVLVTLKK